MKSIPLIVLTEILQFLLVIQNKSKNNIRTLDIIFCGLFVFNFNEKYFLRGRRKDKTIRVYFSTPRHFRNSVV